MLFSGIPFLFYFLPAMLLVYFITPKPAKNAVLLAGSLFFYAWGEPLYILLMAGTIVLGYIFGILIEKNRERKLGRVFTTLSIVSGIGLLVYFKYADFFIKSFNSVTGLSVPLLRIALPIGISFYTFQMLSYTIDVSRGQVKAQRNIINLAAYIAMFPQLIAGPIVRYSDIEKQLVSRRHTLDGIASGVRRFVLGLGKKVLIANTLGELCGKYLASGEPSVVFTWVYVTAAALQIYFDFSGYSDMAIGLGRIMGFDFPENFNYPFISGSITEFWRRWHMTLGSWFRDYLYIPLGGNRVGAARQIINILVVWAATGLWHGAAWNFVVWGLYFALFLVIEKLWLGKYLKKSKVLGHIYLVFFIGISFAVFNADTMGQAVKTVSGIFGGGLPFATGESLFYLRSYAGILLIGILGATPLASRLCALVRSKAAGERALNILEPVFLAAVLLVSVAFLVNGSYNPFLYFRF